MTRLASINEDQRLLHLKGEWVTLTPMSNVAFNTVGWDVLQLVDAGLWEKKSEKTSVHGFMYTQTTYGPIDGVGLQVDVLPGSIRQGGEAERRYHPETNEIEPWHKHWQTFALLGVWLVLMVIWGMR